MKFSVQCMETQIVCECECLLCLHGIFDLQIVGKIEQTFPYIGSTIIDSYFSRPLFRLRSVQKALTAKTCHEMVCVGVALKNIRKVAEKNLAIILTVINK